MRLKPQKHKNYYSVTVKGVYITFNDIKFIRPIDAYYRVINLLTEKFNCQVYPFKVRLELFQEELSGLIFYNHELQEVKTKDRLLIEMVRTKDWYAVWDYLEDHKCNNY